MQIRLAFYIFFIFFFEIFYIFLNFLFIFLLEYAIIAFVLVKKILKKRGVTVDIVTGNILGEVNVVVFRTNDGNYIFKIVPSNDAISPIVDVIEDTLTKY